MDAIETLMSEHRIIEQVIDSLLHFTEEVRLGQRTEKEDLAGYVAFIREFADACHHAKEEGILFAAMVEHGFPRDGGPIAVMLHEHDQGRRLVRTLGERAGQPGDWSAADRQEIAAAAGAYAALLRAHIHKEDAVLYPMAEQHLPPEAMARVGADCDRYEAERTGAGEHERLHRLAEDLVRRHPGAAGSRPAFGGCC